jgi:hypothetical protein
MRKGTKKITVREQCPRKWVCLLRTHLRDSARRVGRLPADRLARFGSLCGWDRGGLAARLGLGDGPIGLSP